MTTTAPPGSYTKTSRDISFAPDGGGGGVLTAQCQKQDGSYVASQLAYDVANMNGALMAVPGGSYSLTSRNIHLENAQDGTYLVAECQKRDGRTWVKSRIKIQDIANIDGELKNV